MPKMSIDRTSHLSRVTLNGPTMGTRWSARLDLPAGAPTDGLRAAFAAAVAEVDAQMSTWRADSDLMRLNRAAPGVWVDLPARLLEVLETALEIGRASGGAFDIGMGDAVRAWGFCADPASEAGIRAALAAPRRPAHEVLEIDSPNRRARKHGPLSADLGGIAKGYGADRLAAVARGAGRNAGLFGIDGELVAMGLQPDGRPWTLAVERPEDGVRALHSVLELHDAAVATSGDYRHFVTLGGRRLAHTMDPARGGPLLAAPASVTVVAPSCMLADGWATALTVLGPDAGADLARRLGLQALFLMRTDEGLRSHGVGPLFESAPETV